MSTQNPILLGESPNPIVGSPPPYTDDPPVYSPPRLQERPLPPRPRDGGESPEDPFLPTYNNSTPGTFYLKGWRLTVLCFSGVVWLLLFVNIYLHITLHYNAIEFAAIGPTGVLVSGHCDSIKTTTKYMRMFFAALATLMLLGTTFTAQVLASPTRSQIDKAHARRTALTLGVLSFKNLRFISRRSAALGGLILVCGVSAGALYNAAFFPVYQSRDYNVALVNEAFIQHPPDYAHIPHTQHSWPRRSGQTFTLTPEAYDTIASRKGDWRILTPRECISAYTPDYQSEYRHLLAVTKSGSSSPTLHNFHAQIITPFTRQHGWLCPRDSHAFEGRAFSCNPWTLTPPSWRIGDADLPISYCLAEKPPSIPCTIEYSLPALLALSLVLATTAVIATTAVFSPRREPPLITPGDAIASFLDEPDEHTEGMCTYSYSDFVPFLPLADAVSPRAWGDARRRIGAAVPYKDWALVYYMLGLTVLAVFAVWRVLMYSHDVGLMDLSLAGQYRMGLGEANQVSVVDFVASARWDEEGTEWGVVVGVVVVVQMVAGVGWVGWCRLMGVMEFAKEYNAFAFRRGVLRVSSAKRGYRCTWWGVVSPRMGVVVGGVAWAVMAVVAQVIFVVRVDFRGVDGRVKLYDGRKGEMGRFYSVGWSTPGVMVLFGVVGVAVVLQLVVAAKKVWRNAPPDAGVCSAAVAAACHDGGVYEGEGEEVKVMWGGQRVYREGRHLGFSRGTVERPVRWGRTRGERGEMTRIVVYS